MPNEFTHPDSTEPKDFPQWKPEGWMPNTTALKCSGIGQKTSANAYTAYKICEVDILKK